MGGLSGTGDAEFDPASDSEDNHCLNRFGKDFNLVFDLTEQFVTPRCNVVESGGFYIPDTAWFTNTETGLQGFLVVYPEGYTPLKPDPMDDFLFKILLVKNVLDGRKESFYPAEDVVGEVTLGEIFPGEVDPHGVRLPNDTQVAIFLAKLHPAEVGSHSVAIVWI